MQVRENEKSVGKERIRKHPLTLQLNVTGDMKGVNCVRNKKLKSKQIIQQQNE